MLVGYSYSNCGSASENFADPSLTFSNIAVTTAADCVIEYDVTVDAGASGGASIDNSCDVSAATEGGNNPATVNASTLTVSTTPNLSTSTKTENDADNYDDMLYRLTPYRIAITAQINKR